MDWREYAAAVRRTTPDSITVRDALLMGAIGLCGEAGEVADMVKKLVFHNHPLDKTAIVKELGDVLWYFTLLCRAVDVSPELVMQANVAKLEARYPDGFSSAASINRGE